MAEFPAMPLWTDAYLADTSDLTTIEHGAYLLLLISMWRNRGELPDDDRRLARYARLTMGQWARIAPTVRRFFKAENGILTQGRLTAEYSFVRQHSMKQSNRSRSRWLKNKETADAAAMPDACRTHAPTPTPSINTSSNPTIVVLEDVRARAPRKTLRGTRLDPAWMPDPDDCQVGIDLGLTPERIKAEHEKFTDYFTAQPGQKGVKLNWNATFRNWLRRAADDIAKRG